MTYCPQICLSIIVDEDLTSGSHTNPKNEGIKVPLSFLLQSSTPGNGIEVNGEFTAKLVAGSIALQENIMNTANLYSPFFSRDSWSPRKSDPHHPVSNPIS